MSTPIRVRFAPSPTGFLHLGGIRSALFDYLIARKTGGQFILRLEDTDRDRLVDGAAKAISGSLEWLGISPDEGVMPDGSQRGAYGPYVQSERLDIYAKYADELVRKGALYPCWCTPERLDGLRHDAQVAKVAFKYDRHCLNDPQSLDLPHVLRFRIPDDRGNISWNDIVRGPVSFNANELDDFVAIKSDGFPTYHFAATLDDHLMEITHVLRGDEWLPSTPKHLLLMETFGYEPPLYAHLPQVLGPDKAKLSKRHGAKPALDYREAGYLPEAVINFLSSLGWNAGEGSTKELYTLDELVAVFSLERIQKSPAVFDAERLNWLNGQYIRQLSPEALLERCEGFWPKAAQEYPTAYRLGALKLVHERLKYLSELSELTEFFFETPKLDLMLLTKTFNAPIAARVVGSVRDALRKSQWTEAGLEATLRPLAEKLEMKTGQLFGIIRAAITGRTAAPGLFATLSLIGKDETIERLDRAIKALT
jgi:glutamyl-tRNA synthetase